MGTFSLPPPFPHALPENSNPVSYVNMISSFTSPFDPWIVPNESNIDTFFDRMSLSPIELDYEDIYSTRMAQSIISSRINCINHSLDYRTSSYPFSCTFFTNERTVEIMVLHDVS